ncbi:V-type ATP synthase subunit C, partial [Enterococcus gallinarum]|nr:V-type ATP synthase subunit C [Enterococcus gallinarum]
MKRFKKQKALKWQKNFSVKKGGRSMRKPTYNQINPLIR